jgi:phage-related tail fiber protein
MCGEVVDADGNVVSVGLVPDNLKPRIESGELKLRISF